MMNKTKKNNIMNYTMSDLTISRIESKRRSYERSVSIRDFEVLLAFLRELGSTFICRSHEICPLVSLL